MHLLDWAVVATYALLSVAFALWFARRHHGHQTSEDYMVAGRRLPWWVVGVADVATGDGADAFWIYVFFTGAFMAYHRLFWIQWVVMLPLGVLWARYWRRLSLVSPGQIYEERYGGRAAGLFRGFSSLYGVVFGTCVLLGYVLRGFTQSLQPFLNIPEEYILLIFCGTTMLYTMLSGLLAVAYSDIAQFALVMLGRVVLCVVLLGVAGGYSVVLAKVQAVRGAAFLTPFPPAIGHSPASAKALFGDFSVDALSLVALLLAGAFQTPNTQLPAVQKSLAAKDERHAAGGMIFNMVLSLVVRILPLALIGMVAIALLPAGRTDTNQWSDLVRAHIPHGVLGLLLVGIAAGYMATLDGVVNFSAASLLNDVYRRFLRPGASNAEQLRFGRLATLAVLLISYGWARVLIGRIDGAWINFINSVTMLFVMPLMMLRWTWWRLNLWGELAGFLLSFPLTYLVWFPLGFKDRPYWQSFAVLFGGGALVVITVTLCTRPEPLEVLRRFYLKARPPGFWGPVAATVEDAQVGQRRRGELRLDVGAALSGVLVAASLVVSMCALLGGHWLLGGALLLCATLCGLLFVHLTVRAGRA